MQQHKQRFYTKDKTRLSSVQSCIRTDDIDLIGDGQHLTYFEMVGNFSFGNDDYDKAVYLWHLILKDMQVPVTHVTCHPDRADHQKLWSRLGYRIQLDGECQWSDGCIGGHCCEVFCDDLEIGNLVNPLDDSVDVGFGLERLIQVIEGKKNVDETSVFDQTLSRVGRDHIRALRIMRENGIKPGSKNKESICRKILRRFMQYEIHNEEFSDWIKSEENLLEQKRIKIERNINNLDSKPLSWWYETHGITEGDIESFRMGL